MTLLDQHYSTLWHTKQISAVDPFWVDVQMSRDQWWCSIWDSGGAVALTYPWSMPIGCEHLPLTPPPICLENGGNKTSILWQSNSSPWKMMEHVHGNNRQSIYTPTILHGHVELNRLCARSSKNNPQHQRDSITTRQLPRNQSQQFSSSQPINRNCKKNSLAILMGPKTYLI